jgi:hypothetical protein
MRFLRQELYFENVPKISLTTAVAMWDVVINVSDTTNFSSTWAIYINSDIITYTGKTPTTFTGCAGIDIAHDNGSEVYQLYDVPTDAGDPYKMYWINNGKEKEVEYVNYQYIQTRYKFFSILFDPTDQKRYIFLKWWDSDYSNNQFLLRYYQSWAEITDETVDIVLPDNYGKTVVAPIVAWELLYITEEQEKATSILNMGYTKLDEMYSYYADEIKKSPRVLKKPQLTLSPFPRRSFDNIPRTR